MSRWFRWYEGTTEDGKFRVVSRNAGVTVRDVIALWAFMLEDASKDEHRGICARKEDFMSAILDFEDGSVEKILEAMEEVSMISVGHGNITISHWGERQFETDKSDGTNAERQRRFRERNRGRLRNGDVTAEKRPETEQITDTEPPYSPPTKKDRAQEFLKFKTVYPKRQGSQRWVVAESKFEAAVRTGADPEQIIAAARRYAAEQQKIGKAGTEFVMQAATWIGQRCWQEYQAVAADGLMVPKHDPRWQFLVARWERENSRKFPDLADKWPFPELWLKEPAVFALCPADPQDRLAFAVA